MRTIRISSSQADTLTYYATGGFRNAADEISDVIAMLIDDAQEKPADELPEVFRLVSAMYYRERDFRELDLAMAEDMASSTPYDDESDDLNLPDDETQE